MLWYQPPRCRRCYRREDCDSRIRRVSPWANQNPFDLDRTPGGSSSGSAAAVAARMLPVAIGSQVADQLLDPPVTAEILRSNLAKEGCIEENAKQLL